MDQRATWSGKKARTLVLINHQECCVDQHNQGLLDLQPPHATNSRRSRRPTFRVESQLLVSFRTCKAQCVSFVTGGFRKRGAGSNGCGRRLRRHCTPRVDVPGAAARAQRRGSATPAMTGGSKECTARYFLTEPQYKAIQARAPIPQSSLQGLRRCFRPNCSVPCPQRRGRRSKTREDTV